MTRLLIALILIAPMCFADPPSTTGLPDSFPELRFTFNPLYHSIGLKLGNVLSPRRIRPIFSTFEGQLMLGLGSNPETAVDRECMQTILEHGTSTRRSNLPNTDAQRDQVIEECALFTNPWRFSFLSSALFDRMVAVKEKPVIIYYINYYVSLAHLLMNTRNEVLDVFATQPDLNIEPNFSIPAWSGIQPEVGVINGRIVQASLEFPIRKSYEVIIQESENANNFRAMSVSDAKLFNYITRAMLTGRQLRIRYMRLYGPHAGLMTSMLNYMTSMRIISVDVI